MHGWILSNLASRVTFTTRFLTLANRMSRCSTGLDGDVHKDLNYKLFMKKNIPNCCLWQIPHISAFVAHKGTPRAAIFLYLLRPWLKFLDPPPWRRDDSTQLLIRIAHAVLPVCRRDGKIFFSSAVRRRKRAESVRGVSRRGVITWLWNYSPTISQVAAKHEEMIWLICSWGPIPQLKWWKGSSLFVLSLWKYTQKERAGTVIIQQHFVSAFIDFFFFFIALSVTVQPQSAGKNSLRHFTTLTVLQN